MRLLRPFETDKVSMAVVRVVLAAQVVLSLVQGALSCASWCQWVPVSAQQYPPDCQSCIGYHPRSTGCASWCQWVPVPTWNNVGECNGCSLASGTVLAVEAGNKTVAQLTSAPGCASWCQYVPPGAHKYVSNCQNCSGALPAHPATPGRCASWCEHVPVPSQSDVSDCTGCLYASAALSAAKTENKTMALLTSTSGCASWCRWVPLSAQQYPPECQTCGGAQPASPATRGGCASWCEWVPVPTWSDVGDCRGCSSLSAMSAKAGDDSAKPTDAQKGSDAHQLRGSKKASSP